MRYLLFDRPLGHVVVKMLSATQPKNSKVTESLNFSGK